METSDGHLTSKERNPRERVTSQNGQEIELRVEELEERIAPKLASNHNETLLVDR
jgi:hypothetical protein